MTTGAAIIDDLVPALQRLSDFGRAIVEPAARMVRENVIVFASIAGWQVVSHRKFRDWANSQVCRRNALILDPLFEDPDPTSRLVHAQLSRRLASHGWTVAGSLSAASERWMEPLDVDIVDDIANSGMTLRYAGQLVEEATGRPRVFITACSTASARAATMHRFPGAAWCQLLDGHFAAIHLRDGCPFVPLAGRVLIERPPIMTANGPVHPRILSTAFRGGLWERAVQNNLVRQAISTALHTVISRLSTSVGRDAIVADVAFSDSMSASRYFLISMPRPKPRSTAYGRESPNSPIPNTTVKWRKRCYLISSSNPRAICRDSGPRHSLFL